MEKQIKNKIIQGDSAEKLKKIPENSIDLVVTDPPYRYGFMGKSWDKKQDFTEIWEECLRVLKPGGFAYIMNAPRSDCQLLLLKELAEVGFNIEFSPIFWTYASGFPKAANMSKLIDKRLGVEQEVIGNYEHPGRKNRSYQTTSNVFSGDRKGDKIERPLFEEQRNTSNTRVNPYHSGKNLINGIPLTCATTPEAQKFDGGYAGFQPKPAVEMINVVMKPITEKSYIDQALENGKGVSWFDDCRVPYTELQDVPNSNGKPLTPGDSGIYNWNEPMSPKRQEALLRLKKKMVGGRLSQEKRWTYGDKKVDGFKPQNFEEVDINLKGRFPANLLISDNILDKEFSRYFSLDAWWKEHIRNLPKELRETFPFLYCPKPSKDEKNKGLKGVGKKVTDGRKAKVDNAFQRGETIRKNTHPTGKPIKLMSYLITLGSRPKDLILDPFAGSGTTGIACKLEDRRYILIEKDPEYFEIMKARLKAYKIHNKLM